MMMERRGFLGSLLALVFGWKVLEEGPTQFHNEYLPGDPSFRGGSSRIVRATDLSPYLTDTDAWYFLDYTPNATFHWRPRASQS